MRVATFFIAAAVLVCAAGAIAAPRTDNDYAVTILVSNEVDEAPLVDDKLKNAWGIAASATSPWWVANNGTGTSTVYTGAGVKAPVEVNVPGAPTGIVNYGGSQFEVTPGHPAMFIWASEDGTFSAWNRDVDPANAKVVFSDPGSVYKGLAIHGDTLFTSDFTECEVEAFDGTFTQFDTAGGFEDDSIPARYCPFGIQAIGDSIFVTYAKKNGTEDVAGKNHGFVREFDTDGNLVAKVASRDHLNSPWGIAKAPSGFGKFSGCLLVGDFGDGRIHGFCLDKHGKYQHSGRLESGRDAVVIDGLWGIGFGNDNASGWSHVLYFAAGPDDEENGYFGKIDVVE